MMMEGSPTSPEAPPPPRQRPRTGQDDTAKPGPQPMVSTQEDPVSTYSLDTDRASYTRALQRAQQGLEIDPAEVRAEEWINSLAYAYNTSFRKDEFAIHTQWQLKLRDSFQMRVPGTWGRKDDYSLVTIPSRWSPVARNTKDEQRADDLCQNGVNVRPQGTSADEEENQALGICHGQHQRAKKG